MVKTCMNCQYKIGKNFNSATCVLSGSYCSTERAYPTYCGKNYEAWKEKEIPMTIWEKIKKSYKALTEFKLEIEVKG